MSKKELKTQIDKSSLALSGGTQCSGGRKMGVENGDEKLVKLLS